MKTDLTVAGYIFRKNSLDFKPELLLIKHKKLRLWLPVGGHIKANKNETPPEAMIREAREEVGLDIILLAYTSEYCTLSEVSKCAIPFYSNIHNVGDHDHYCQFYICEAGDQIVKLNKREISYSKWFSKRKLGDAPFVIDNNNLAYLAFKKYEEIKYAMDRKIQTKKP
ncbi:MAG: NUDIX hydrolase [Candidatus Pacearchaeota archaeon]|nr:NUDIX hydrolase [Candidatus Pacearchaeota archaeon]